MPDEQTPLTAEELDHAEQQVRYDLANGFSLNCYGPYILRLIAQARRSLAPPIVDDAERVCPCNCHDPAMRKAMDMQEHKHCGECAKLLADESDAMLDAVAKDLGQQLAAVEAERDAAMKILDGARVDDDWPVTETTYRPATLAERVYSLHMRATANFETAAASMNRADAAESSLAAARKELETVKAERDGALKALSMVLERSHTWHAGD
jgi:hypothetical protein